MLILLWPCAIPHLSNTPLSLPARESAFELAARAGVNLVATLALENGAGDWLFADGSAILQSAGALAPPARPLQLSLADRK